MNVLKGAIVSIFLFFAALMCFIFFYRLANDKTPFVGLSDVLIYFERVDIISPIEDLKEHWATWISVAERVNDFKEISFAGVTDITSFFKVIGSWFTTLGATISSFFGVFDIILTFFKDILIFLGDYLVTIFGFFPYILRL